MAKIDRVIIKVNGKVYSFLNPAFMDQSEYEYFRTNFQDINKLAVIIPYNKNFFKRYSYTGGKDIPNAKKV